MKYYIIIICIIGLMACESNSLAIENDLMSTNKSNDVDGKQESNAKQNIEPSISSIRTVYNTVNSDKTLKEKVFKIETEENEACDAIRAEVKVFKNTQGQIRKIIYKSFGDSHELEQTFYYDKNELVFVFESSSYFPNLSNAKPQVTELRVYISNNKVIKIIEGKESKDNITEDAYVMDRLKLGNGMLNAKDEKDMISVICTINS